MKKVVRLTESDLINIVKRVINEQEEEVKNPVYLMGDFSTDGDIWDDLEDDEEEMDDYDDDEELMENNQGYLIGAVDGDEIRRALGEEPVVGKEYDCEDGYNIDLFKRVAYRGVAYNDDNEIIEEPKILTNYTQGTLTVVTREEFYETLKRIVPHEKFLKILRRVG